MNEHIGRLRRFTLADRHELALTVEWADGGEPTTTPAVLLDISAGGVKLSLDSHLKLHQLISLTIVSAELKLDLTVSAKVCWLRPGENDHWTAGCAFVPELSPAALETLFASGLVERRIFPRHPIQLAASAQWELDPARFDVELQDVSTGGVCMRSPQPGKIAARVVVFVPDGDGREVPVAVRCQWHVAAEGGYLIGCAYVNVDGNAAMHEALARAAPPPKPTSRPSRRRLWVAAACSLALGWVTWRFGEAPIREMITRLLAQFARSG
ncbi:MAG TPA: PilZ domain-containing protein [Pirellulales bacterium]|nr:PilZ domain-containing protein [Pirellulales bacterium]